MRPAHLHRVLIQLSCLLAMLIGCTPSSKNSYTDKVKDQVAVALELRSLPELGCDNYRATPYIEMAVQLQKMGRDEACKWLLEEMDTKPYTNKWASDYSHQMAVLGRMLFTNVGPALLGGMPVYLPNEPWQTEPIEVMDGVPFSVVTGFEFSSHPQSGKSYLSYCMTYGGWNSFPFEIKTDKQKREALGNMLALTKWTRSLEDHELECLRKQIE